MMVDEKKKANEEKISVEKGREKYKEVRGNEEDKRTKIKNELKCMCAIMWSLMNENKREEF